MTWCEFSEFTYGYACIREAEVQVSRAHGAVLAPIQPSLRDEEELGWDAAIPAIDYALFLQFKRTYHVGRARRNSPTSPHVGVPHYRFAVDTASKQFEALTALEATIRTGTIIGDVYYAAPVFYEQSVFEAFYAARSVLRNSVLVPPRDFPADREQHWFAIAPTGASCILSEPLPPKWATRWGDLVDRISLRLLDAAREPFSLLELEERLLTAAQRASVLVPDWLFSEQNALARIQLLANAFGCVPFLILSEPAALESP